eukprot:11201852-Lingulodinium_polyedra.AAC.1
MVPSARVLVGGLTPVYRRMPQYWFAFHVPSDQPGCFSTSGVRVIGLLFGIACLFALFDEAPGICAAAREACAGALLHDICRGALDVDAGSA